MAITTYSELTAAVSDWLDRDDLSAQVETFISLAEARFKREIRIREMETREELTIPKDARYVALPDGLLAVRSLRIQMPQGLRMFRHDVLEISADEMAQRSRQNAKCPQFFTIWNGQIEFDGPADQEYTAELFCWSELPALSSDTTNALLERAPDVYLYASLSASAPFLLNDERIPVWEGFYQEARDRLNQGERAYRRSGPLTVRIPGRVF